MGARRPTQTTVLVIDLHEHTKQNIKKKYIPLNLKNRFAFEIHNIFLLFAYILFLLLRHEK